MMRKSTPALLLCCALAALLSGCSSIGPKPWEKGDLANPEMAFDPDPLKARFDDHIYFSKESAAGGASVGGGGCGCN